MGMPDPSSPEFSRSRELPSDSSAIEAAPHGLPPTPWQIREQVERLAAHPTFSRSPSSLKLLRFFGANILATGGRPVSQRVVADVLLGLSDEFRPTENPLVRMQVVRLRKKLIDYYAGDGAADRVLVSLPKGRYCLVADWNPGLRSAGVEAEPAAGESPPDSLAARERAEFEAGIDATPGRPPAGSGAGRPVVLIAELADGGLGPDFQALAQVTATLLVPNLLGNDRFWAIGPLSRWRAGLDGLAHPHGLQPEAACGRYHADYVLVGQLAREGTAVAATLQLVPRSGGDPVWTTWCSEDLTALPADSSMAQTPVIPSAGHAFGARVAAVGEILAGRIAVLLREAFQAVAKPLR